LNDVENTDIGTKRIVKIVFTGKRKPDAIGTDLPDLHVLTFKCKNNGNDHLVLQHGFFSENVEVARTVVYNLYHGSILDQFLGDSCWTK
jgi:hypothetical protein